MDEPTPCTKGPFLSARAARAFMRGRGLSCRLRIYFCGACKAWHLTNPEKR